MKPSMLLCSLIFFAWNVNSQVSAPTAIPGTKYKMQAPTGFKLAQSFSGFSNDSLKASIMVSEIPSSLGIIAAGFSKEKLTSSGLTFISRDSLLIDNKPALVLALSQEVGGIQYLKKVLLFGDSAKTTIVNGIYPANFPELANPIQASLLSIQYHANQDDDPMHAVNFLIDTTGSKLLLAKYQNGSLLFSKDGKIPTTAPTLIVGSSFSSQSIPNKKQFALDRFKQLPGGLNAKIEQQIPIKQGSLEGYEIVSKAKIYDSREGLLYQCLFFDKKGNYFLVVGIANVEMTKNLQVFRKMARTLQPK